MKKILSLILCLATVLGCISVALASGDTSIVKYEASETYTVSVPEYIIPQDVDEEVDTDAYSVSASNVRLSDGKELKISVAYDGTLTESNGVETPYKLVDSNGDITSGDVILTQTAGQPDAVPAVTFGAAVLEKAKYAGVYADTATFVTDASEKTYTAEEIEADEHLFAIGKTVPEYVVAEFNDDFSEVTIFANGENSDGRMMDFRTNNYNPQKQGVSPMCIYPDTLKRANVVEGVTSLGAFAFQFCEKLASVTLPNSLKTFGQSGFDGCSSLASVTIPSSVTSINNSAFWSLGSLTIYGSAGSYAETWASENGHTFIAE